MKRKSLQIPSGFSSWRPVQRTRTMWSRPFKAWPARSRVVLHLSPNLHAEVGAQLWALVRGSTTVDVASDIDPGRRHRHIHHSVSRHCHFCSSVMSLHDWSAASSSSSILDSFEHIPSARYQSVQGGFARGQELNLLLAARV
mmetsp:Transcript_11948/g.25113  ORF Transcript_11948/g.25113 Transcript_11948/m.25113 type:complete len:142 (+) Transcript_11948:482-907(+)